MEKVLLVMGASSDVGLEIIKAVHKNYERIYAHFGHTADALLELKKELGDKLFLIQDDLSAENGGEIIVSTIKEQDAWPDHIVHLPAPKYENYKFQKAGWEPFEAGLQVSLRSAVVVLQPLLTKMVKDKREGRVILMLTSYIENIPPRYTTPYVTVKSALYGLMKGLSAEYDTKGIMVNGVSPSLMETKFLENVPGLIVEQNAANSPFGRNLHVDEVVPTFEFLLSDGAARITGQNFVISGGQ